MSASNHFAQSLVVDLSIRYDAQRGGSLFDFDNWIQSEPVAPGDTSAQAAFFRHAKTAHRVDVLVLPGGLSAAWLVELKDFRNCKCQPNLFKAPKNQQTQGAGSRFVSSMSGKIDESLSLLSSHCCPASLRVPFDGKPYQVGIHMEASLPQSAHEVAASLIANSFTALKAFRRGVADETLVLLNANRINAVSTIPWTATLLPPRT